MAATIQSRFFNETYQYYCKEEKMKKQGLWSEKEIKFLRKYYPVKGGKYVARALGRSPHSVYNHAAKFGLKVLISIYYRPYTPREIILIKKYYPAKGASYAAKLLDRSPGAIRDKARKLKVRRINTTKWSIKEIEYLRKWYFKKRPLEIAKKLKRTTPAVVTQARKLGLTKHKVKRWNKYEELFLINNFRKMTYKQIAKHLNRTRTSVQGKLSRMKMKKKKLRKWKPQEKRILSRLYGKITRAELASRLNRTLPSVVGYAVIQKKTKKHAPTFTEKEKKFILKNYLKMTNRQIAQKLNRSYMAIFRMAARLGLKANQEKMNLRPEGFAPPFTDKEKEFIRNNYLKMTNKEIAGKLKRKSVDGIRKYAKKIGLAGKPEKRKYPRTHDYVYSEREKNFIRNNYLKMTNKQIGLKLNRPEDGIAAMVGKLGLSGNPARAASWRKKAVKK